MSAACHVTFTDRAITTTKTFSVEANRKYYIKNQNKKEKKRGHEEETTSYDSETPRGGVGGSGGGQAYTNNGGGERPPIQLLKPEPPKILQFPARYAEEELRSGQRGNYTVEQVLARNAMLPDVDTDREYWTFTPEQATELASLSARVKENKESVFYLPRRQDVLTENARRKAQNDITKTRIDMETKVLQERQDTIDKLMGDILADLSKASLDKVEKYVKPVEEAPVVASAAG